MESGRLVNGVAGEQVNWLLTACLWTHVAVASWWVIASIVVALAGAVMSGQSAEGREFAVRVVPKFNRANMAAAAILLVTGLVNLLGAGARRDFHFSTDFSRVLAIKIGLYVLMIAALTASLRVARGLRAENPGEPLPPAMGRLVALSGFIALAGAGAMILGVWLVGD